MKRTRLLTALAACTIALSPAATTLTNSTNTVLAAKKPKRAKRHAKRTRSNDRFSSECDPSRFFGSAYKKPFRTVYIKIPTSNHLYKDTVDALNAWNATGAFTFKQIHNKKKADIVVRIYSKDDGLGGYTDPVASNYGLAMPIKMSRKFGFWKSTIYLNRYTLDQEDGFNTIDEASKIAAEHELGHAMGLTHSDNFETVMYISTHYPISSEDIQAVKKLYHEN